jgi:hypothetical protein
MRSSLGFERTRASAPALRGGATVWLVALGTCCLVGFGCTVSTGDGDFDDFDGAFSDFDGSTAHDGGGGKGGSGNEDEDGGTTTKPPSKPDAGGSGDNTVKLTDLPRLIAGATCDALEDCLGSKELLADTLGGRDCAQLNENLLLSSPLRYLSASVDAGLVLFRPEEAETCFSDLRALSCDARSNRWPASCKLMLIGTADAGESCTINQDCSGKAFCDLGSLESCPGTCVPLQTKGMTCNHNDDDQCEDGLVCFRGHCEALGKSGDDCDDTLPRCAPGLVCPDPAGSKCAAIPTIYFRKLDEACEIGVELCEPALVCESVSGTMGVCKHTVAKGASCKRADPNQCPLDQYCDATSAGMSGTCQDRPADGVACLTNRAQSCADGHICIDGTCRALAGVDDSCETAAQCYSGVCSDTGKCAGPLMCEAP